MIWDSELWKRDLVRRGEALARRTNQKRWTARSFAKLEQDVMIGCYAVRKLVESRKVSDNLVKEPIALKSFPAVGKPVTFMNWHRLEDLYDADRPRPESLDLVSLCNQIIHSYVFLPLFGESGRLASILFASDRTKNKRVYSLRVLRLGRVFHTVGINDPVYFAMRLNPETNDYDVKVGSHAPRDDA